ncbi:NAD-dependent epimerase/dehydratase family protein [Devosia sp. SL43]|uniref:NAD-dependent epimerase/dehydratase family protein n=1 Tax=Devosia sp. SL43 TaxID=2806348 RepID=UPI001EFF7B25|nr:NAD-dependent epimerase/dehydratase family protein [Devosia sp. SL43]UJW86441.1 NAD-dependent epimerase/dehydratase family protein [Devosia sp. SL43]
MRVFVTGTAGFIGYHLARRLLDEGHTVIGFDAVTDYYDVALKRGRLAELARYAGFTSIEGWLEDADLLAASLQGADAEVVVHLAAQAGVRFSIEQPQSYVGANLVGTGNLLEAARASKPAHLLFASSSSVYGGNIKVPFSELDAAHTPISLYAATKKGGEAMAHAYAHLFDMPTTCLRFFTVYGPWGRPDMALFKFVAAILEGRPIDIYGGGEMRRDFTYIDDLIEAVMRIIPKGPVVGERVEGDSLSPVAPYRCVNLAGGHPEPLMDFVAAIEAALGRKADSRFLPLQAGDPRETAADVGLLRRIVGDLPHTPIDTGIARFVAWYRQYHSL